METYYRPRNEEYEDWEAENTRPTSPDVPESGHPPNVKDKFHTGFGGEVGSFRQDDDYSPQPDLG